MRSPSSLSRFAGSLLVAANVALVAVSACSSNPPAGTGPANAPLGGEQALGTPCDPSLPKPCETLTDVCSVAVCDPASHRCVRVAVDAGPICGTTPPPCPDCDGGDDAGDASFDAGEASLADADAQAADADAGSAADGAVDASDASLEPDSPAGD